MSKEPRHGGRGSRTADRQARQAAALRENLRRRKAQAHGRARASDDGDNKTTAGDASSPPGRALRGKTD
jgi:hypothetical protein